MASAQGVGYFGEVGEMKSDLEALQNYISELGFDPEDMPYTPIKKEWEEFPIVQAIRAGERELGVVYHSPCNNS